MPGIIKIGLTENSVSDRVLQLDTTSVPVPFQCYYAARVEDHKKIERALHTAFGDFRVRPNREFFRMDPFRVKAILEVLALEDVTPKNELVATPADSIALRSTGVPVGATLNFVKDANLTAVVTSDTTVNYKGTSFSLTLAALEALRDCGYNWTSSTSGNGSMMTKLGKLEKVDLRKVWKHEARNFSTWLVLPENLEVLGAQLGIEIEPLGTEIEVGRFRIDILAKEPNTGENIIIENQLESTNHDHLGKVITYAAGLDARYLIWIVKEVLPEHLKAIEWLNEHLDDTVRCFLVKIEGYGNKIFGSNFAPI
eukprot:gene1051-1061_t